MLDTTKKLGKEKITLNRNILLLFIAFGFILVFSIVIRNFFSLMTFTNIVRSSAVFTIISIGMTMVIVVCGIDLSVGSNMALCGAIAATIINYIGPTSLFGATAGTVAALIVGTVYGIVNGILCGYFRISPLIATLAMQFVGRGLTLLVTKSSRIVVPNEIFNWLGSGQWHIGSFVIPRVIIVLVPIMVFAIWCVKNLNFGVRLYAVGGNERAAAAAGVNVSRFKLSVYTLTGLLCGIASIITVGRSSSAQPLAGIDLEFTVITAVVLGGTSLLGGVGSISGTFCGCLLMGIITFGINMINIPPFWNYIIKGIFILIAVLSDRIILSVKDIIVNTAKSKEKATEKPGERKLGHLSKSVHHTLELKGINKSFSGVTVLKDVNLKIESGKVHALLGENGAGKSTLIKILSGVYQKDKGQILIDGNPVEIHSTSDSKRLGISVIYQEFALIPELNVMQNIFLGKELRKFGWYLNIGAMKKRVSE